MITPVSEIAPLQSELGASALSRVLGELGLEAARPGRHIQRDARGWKTSAAEVAVVVTLSIKPSFERPVVAVAAQIDGRWLASAAVGEDISTSAVEVPRRLVARLFAASPNFKAAVRRSGPVLDGTQFVVHVAGSVAEATVTFVVADASSDQGLEEMRQAAIGLIRGVSIRTNVKPLRDWIDARRVRSRSG